VSEPMMPALQHSTASTTPLHKNIGAAKAGKVKRSRISSASAIFILPRLLNALWACGNGFRTCENYLISFARNSAFEGLCDRTIFGETLQVDPAVGPIVTVRVFKVI
jgi:hypothetical protein